MRERWFLFTLMLLLVSSFAFALTDANLVSYWKLDNVSGNATDSKGSFTGTASNITYNLIGKIGRDFNFVAANTSYVDFGNSAALIPANFTYCGWIFPTANNVNLYINRDAGGATTQSFNISQDGSNKWSFQMYNTAGTPHTAVSSATVSLGTWHFICGEFDGAKLYLWVDNVLQTPVAFTGSRYTGNLANLRLGPRSSDNYGPPTAGIDEVSFWDKNISAADINSLWNNGNGFTYPFVSPITVDININVQDQFDFNNLVNSMDCNSGLVSYLNQMSPRVTTFPDTNKLFSCVFTSLGYDGNTQLIYTDSNKIVTILLKDNTPPQVFDINLIGFRTYLTDKNYISGTGNFYSDFNHPGHNVTNCTYQLTNSGGFLPGTVTDSNRCTTATFSITNNQDYNFQIKVTDESLNSGYSNIREFSGDTNAPTTTFSSFQVTNTKDQNITLTCFDSNVGCKTIHYKIDGNASWTDLNALTGNTKTFLYNGAGNHTIQYFSTDLVDNNEATQTSTFVTSGQIKFNFFDENTGTALSGVTVDYNGTPITTITNNYTLSLASFPTTSTNYIFTIDKNGYSTRYFQVDLNNVSDYDTNFSLLPSDLSLATQFQFFAPDQTTKLVNSYVTVSQFFRGTKVGRLKTDSQGIVTFQLNTSDGNYGFHIEYGNTIYDYNSLSATINRPKDEATLLDINATWNVAVTGIVAITYTSLNTANKVLVVYANTYSSYLIRIDSNSTNPVYFPRNYSIKLLGNPTTFTLQPYLISNTSGFQTGIKSLSANTLIEVPNVDVKIYRLLPGSGRTLVEEEITSSTGDAIASLITNQTYYFDIYMNNVLLSTLTIVGPSFAGQTIYIKINDTNTFFTGFNSNFYDVNFYPSNPMLHSYDNNLIQVISLLDFNSGVTNSSFNIQVVNTDVNGVIGNNVVIYNNTITSNAISVMNWIDLNSTTQTLNGVHYDTNGFLVVNIVVTNSEGTFTYPSFYYVPFRGFNFTQSIGFDIRPIFGCVATNDSNVPCPSLILFALFISICIAVSVSIAVGYVSMSTIGLLFIFLIGIFTYIAWIPMLLFALMATGTFGLIIAGEGRRI